MTDFDNTREVVEDIEYDKPQFHEPTQEEKDLTAFVVDHTDRWRDYRDQNNLDDWDKYERIFRGIWAAQDKLRESERSRIISPATQQAIETRHAEVMEAIFGQGEFFDIKDDINDANKSGVDVEKLKNQLNEDFAQDKIRKSIDSIVLMAEIYGTGIAEVMVSKEKYYYPATIPIDNQQQAYGVTEENRVCVKLNPINPKNFLFDPNGTSIDDCMGVAIEKYVSIHKIVSGITSGKYKKVDIGTMYVDNSLEATQEVKTFQDEKVLLLTYYGLLPRNLIETEEFEEIDENTTDSTKDYTDMVEGIVIIANGNLLLKAETSPYMMQDRPVLSYQADTVPNRLLGRGTAEKAYNMQVSIDSSARSHMDSLALTVAPMVAVDATRLPRGAKFEVKPGKAFMTNGAPQEIIYPFNFGVTDGAAMNTSKEFERMLLMATATIDSNGQVSQVARDSSGLDMATATLIKKYKRTLVNFQEDFLIPFVKKAAWRYMQFDPQRYPSVDVKFIPKGTLGIIAREYEQKQLAFLIQTLGADSPLAPVLMKGIVANSSLPNKEEMLAKMDEMSKPNPQMQQMAQQQAVLALAKQEAEVKNIQSETYVNVVQAQLAPKEAEAKIMNAISTNLPNEDDAATREFDRRVKIADLMLKEEEVKSKKAIVQMQMEDKKVKREKGNDYIDKLQSSLESNE